MEAAGAKYGDVRHALEFAVRCKAQANERWKVRARTREQSS